MLKIAKTEFYKLKRYSVVWIGVATMLTVVLLTRFMATASDGAVHTLEYFSNSVIWNNFSLIFPATITLIAGYIIERERVDDTLKNILTIPIPFRKLLAGKLIAVGGLAIILAAIEFVFTMIIFFISRFPGFSFAGMILALVRPLINDFLRKMAKFRHQENQDVSAGTRIRFFIDKPAAMISFPRAVIKYL